MNDNVTKLRVVASTHKPDTQPAPAKSLTDDADEMLKSFDGKLVEALVVGMTADGKMMVQATHGIRSSVWLTECAKQIMMEQSFDDS